MNIPLELAKRTIRFSTGKMTTEKEIKQAVKIIQNLIK
jgi:cysteine sulfinate desulfinase/cysteine desulfurase-like protein